MSTHLDTTTQQNKEEAGSWLSWKVDFVKMKIMRGVKM